MNEKIQRNSSVFGWLTIFWTVVILYLTLSKGGPCEGWWCDIPYFDKFAHIGIFAIWTVFFSLKKIDSRNNWMKHLIIVCIIGMFLASMTEYLQQYVPNRVPDILDFFANVAGLIIGGLATTFVIKKNE